MRVKEIKRDEITMEKIKDYLRFESYSIDDYRMNR